MELAARELGDQPSKQQHRNRGPHGAPGKMHPSRPEPNAPARSRVGRRDQSRAGRAGIRRAHNHIRPRAPATQPMEPWRGRGPPLKPRTGRAASCHRTRRLRHPTHPTTCETLPPRSVRSPAPPLFGRVRARSSWAEDDDLFTPRGTLCRRCGLRRRESRRSRPLPTQAAWNAPGLTRGTRDSDVISPDPGTARAGKPGARLTSTAMEI